MRSRFGSVGILLRHELRMLLRDRRTIVFSIVLPLVVMPVLLFSSRLVEERRQKKLEATTFTYALGGSEATFVRELLASRRQLPDDDGADPPKFDEKEVEDPSGALAAQQVHLHIRALAPADVRAEKEEKEDPGVGRGKAREEGPQVPLIRIEFLGNRDSSRDGARKMRALLEEVRSERRDGLLRGKGFPVDPAEVLQVEDEDVATEAEVTGSTLGKFLTALLMFFLFTGGSVIATDSIAGEKERGTLETLLTTAADRLQIVIAKLLAIVAVAVFISVTQVLNILVYVGLGLIPLPKGFVIDVSPATLLVLLILFLPLAALISSILLLLSGRAKSYKEAQLNFFPVVLLGAFPALAAVMPGLDLRSAVVLLPVANTSIAVREVLSGRFDWPFLALAWIVTAAAAAWAMRTTVRSLSVERLITAGGSDDDALLEGSQALFSRNVLRWFAVIWVLLFVVAVNVEALSSMPRQVLFNVVFLFGGGSLAIILWYRLDPRQVLALRAPRPAVWVGVLAGVPAAFLTGIGVFRLADLVFPVPEEMLEALGRGLMPEDVAFWQLVILVSLLPGLFEEIAFRGVLLHGLRRRFRPAVLCVVVGLIFGFFHVSLFRIVPTMYLGVVLSAVTLLTGSIFPAIAWHALNNLLAIVMTERGVALDELEAPVYVAAAAVLALSFWIIYRNRTPYPGLRPWRRRSLEARRSPGEGQ